MKNLQRTLSLAILISIFSCQPEKKEEPQSKFSFATPKEVGMSIDSLAKIEDLVMSYVDAGKFTGAVTLVAKEGKIVYESEVGWNDSLRQESYTKSSIFRMASMTKPFTSVAAMQLVEQGKLSLDDPVSKYIPSFSSPKVLTNFNPQDSAWGGRPANREATVRHLITHTAGVPYGFMNPPVNGAILAKNDIPDLATHRNITLEKRWMCLVRSL